MDPFTGQSCLLVRPLSPVLWERASRARSRHLGGACLLRFTETVTGGLDERLG